MVLGTIPLHDAKAKVNGQIANDQSVINDGKAAIAVLQALLAGLPPQ
jgi:hypothetical protein